MTHARTIDTATRTPGAARWMRAVLFAAIIVLLLAGMTLAGEIKLRGTAFVEADQPITLSELAALTGPDAEAHAERVIIPDPAEAAGGALWFEIDTEAVRAALAAQGVNLGRLAISGSPCTVRLLGQPVPKPDTPEPRSRERHEPEPIELPVVTTIRGTIAMSVCGMMGIEPADLRLGYPGSEPTWLDTPRPSQRVLALPRSSANNARLLVEVKIYDGETLVESQTVRVDALIRRSVLTLASGLERGELITEASLLPQTLWTEPSALAPIADTSQAIGLIARRKLAAGTVLLPDHLEQPILVRRNELVRVTAITRGVVVETEAHAMSEGRLGDRIQVKRAGSNERFTAVVEARGRVVVRMD